MFEYKLTKKGLFIQDYGFSAGLGFLLAAIVIFIAAAVDDFFDTELLIFSGALAVVGFIICFARYKYLNAVCRNTKSIDGKVTKISYNFFLRCRTAVYEYTFEGKDYSRTCYFTRYSSVRDRMEGSEVKMAINPDIPERALPEYMYF